MALNCSVPPEAMLGSVGVTVIDCKTAAVTVSTVVPVTPANAALMDDVPFASDVARPAEPGSLEIMATDVFADPQITCEVRSCVDLSE